MSNRILILGFMLAAAASAQLPTELWLRGYSVIPTPRNVRLATGEVVVDTTWVIDSGQLGDSHIASRTLRGDLESFHGLSLRNGGAGSNVVRLALRAGTVATKADREIDRQAYVLRIEPGRIEITGNDAPGLFYGVQTLVQLCKRDPAGRLVVPRGEVEDWPSLQLRFLHWDTKHHQDRIETLKRYLDWSARFKVNMIGFELEDKFEYPSHPLIGAPGAFTAAELQEIVNYGLERFIQVVPEIQSQAHLSYVLKHPEFAELRADGNNYQIDLCNPASYDLIFSMYDDAIKATRGVDYFYVSTDEVYYAGIGGKCQKPYNPENRSLQWVEFVQKAHEFLKSRGRRMLIWGEYPLLPQHVKLIPPDVIDGVSSNPGYLATENEMGMRQLIYVSTNSSGNYLFPGPFRLEGGAGATSGRLDAIFQTISSGRMWQGKPIGVFGAAWDDSGPHNEVFWLGWSAVAQYAWTPGTPSVEQHTAEFMSIYYGPKSAGLVEIYRTLQGQSSAWSRTWDRVISRERGPGYGNSYGKGTGTQRHDLTLIPPPVPALPDLKFQPAFAAKYAAWLAEARQRQLESDQLVHTIQARIPLVERNVYNLEVILTVARFVGHHWRLMLELEAAEKSLAAAESAAGKKNPRLAVGHLVAASNAIAAVKKEESTLFEELKTVYEKSRHPNGRSANGRKFVHVLDDTKDHWAARRADLTFLIAPEQGIGLDQWRKDLMQVVENYAKQNNVPVRGLREARLEE